ncbi:MAG: hypothetical protein JSW45_06735 [Thiotrichales bacterium]|nr:MAG: hypothetical protein JSW45_06735 [Thiotrichales bacterium]
MVLAKGGAGVHASCVARHPATAAGFVLHVAGKPTLQLMLYNQGYNERAAQQLGDRIARTVEHGEKMTGLRLF